MNALDLLKEQFNGNLRLVEKRPKIQQLYAPLYHEDGDMVDIFLDIEKDKDLSKSNIVRISDHGLTLMKLSYAYDLDTPNKEKIFHKILSENGVNENRGELFIDTTPESLYPSILQFAQTVGKVCNMRQFKREVLESLFDEMIEEFINKELQKYNPRKSVCPIKEKDEYEVDWEFRPNGTPLYLFGVKDLAKARLATISCQAFQLSKIKFKSMVVHDDFEKLNRKDRVRLTSACDKQFTSFEDFKENAVQYLDREAYHA